MDGEKGAPDIVEMFDARLDGPTALQTQPQAVRSKDLDQTELTGGSDRSIEAHKKAGNR